jgi:hypothetical protein
VTKKKKKQWSLARISTQRKKSTSITTGKEEGVASHTAASSVVEAACKPSTTGFAPLKSTGTLIRIFLEIFGEDVLILPVQVFIFLVASLCLKDLTNATFFSFEDLIDTTSFPFEDLTNSTSFPLVGDTSFFEGDTSSAITISLDFYSEGMIFPCVTQVSVSTHHPAKPKPSLFKYTTND